MLSYVTYVYRIVMTLMDVNNAIVCDLCLSYCNDFNGCK